MKQTDRNNPPHGEKWYSLKYGKGKVSFNLGECTVLSEIIANSINTPMCAGEEILRSLNEPIGTPRLGQIVRPGEKICIIASDITRPCPTHLMLPPIVEELVSAGISLDDITMVFALGIHRKHTPEEMKKLAGEEMYSLIRVQDSNPDDTIILGETSLHTPVHITRCVADADRRICLGNIEMHYFAGYSGGAKAIMPGVSNREAINANHAMMTESFSIAGEIARNRVRSDIEEAGDICGIDFILNVILDENKQVVQSFAGDHKLAHRAGCAFLDKMYKIQIPEQADIVIASAGGFPKDINIYQAQKALDNARHAVKKDGIIILLAHCGEGFGEEVFEKWLLASKKPQDLIERVRKHFELGGHKAAAIAMVLEQSDVYFVSNLPPEQAGLTYMKPFSSIESAIEKAIEKFGPKATVILMPQAGSTLPILNKCN